MSRYLDQVLDELWSRQKLTTEDLYRLNEALFNSTQDLVGPRTGEQCVKLVEQIHRAYAAGRLGSGDANFFYDFLGLMSTMQNLSFIKYSSRKMVSQWIHELITGGGKVKPPSHYRTIREDDSKEKAAAAEVAKLKAELQKFKDLRAAFDDIAKFQPPKSPQSIEEKGQKDEKAKVVDFFDPHFHIWDLSEDSPSKHDKAVLFEPKGPGDTTINPYIAANYEDEFKKVDDKKINHIGGVFVEAMSVCFPGKPGEDLNPFCVAEAKWTADELSKSKKKYLIVGSACLEAKNADETLAELCKIPAMRGIRQILNKDPNWPRQNEMSSDLLDSTAWRSGFGLLKKYGLRFDMQVNPHQFAKAAEFLSEHKEITVILNHLGCWQLDDLTNEEYWSEMQKLADLPNVWVKLSMLCYTDKKWRPNRGKVLDAVKRVIRMFGVDRCFFASNYPVDIKDGWPAGKLVPAFLSIAEEYGTRGTRKLFSTNAKKCYGFREGLKPPPTSETDQKEKKEQTSKDWLGG